MKKYFFLFIIITTSLYGQTHRFIYDLAINRHGDKENITMTLDINNNDVKFYDYEFIRNDSINKITKQNRQAFSEIDQLLYRKSNSNQNYSMVFEGYDSYVITSNDKMSWQIENEHKKLGNYNLQKATTSFGGRQWTAWFNPDIPFQEGPYKFRGLPGLIFEIYDAEDIFHYTMIKSQNLSTTYDTSYFLETHYGKKPLPLTLQQFHKIKMDSYNNIVEIHDQYRKAGVDIDGDGHLSSKEAIQKERKQLQDQIRNYYTPIEKNNAIPYPES